MQNIDFYSGRNNRTFHPNMDAADPEFYTRTSKNIAHEQDRIRKKASRMLFLISALCIISFTLGLVIGIKFASNSERELMDQHTYSTVTDLSKKVGSLLQKGDQAANTGLYPKQQYPFMIKIGEIFASGQSKEIANFLSKKGHTIILAKHNDNFKIYVGPYKNTKDAENALQTIHSYKNTLINEAKVIQRL